MNIPKAVQNILLSLLLFVAQPKFDSLWNFLRNLQNAERIINIKHDYNIKK